MTQAPDQPSSPPVPKMVLPYGTETKSKHDQLYTILLAVLAFFLLIAIIAVTTLPNQNPESRPAMRMVALVEALYVAAIVTTIIVRLASPAKGRLITKALNIVLLVYFPLGTALAIYGFRKVDKQPDTQAT